MFFCTIGKRLGENDAEYSVKVLYPIDEKRRTMIKNEWEILICLKQKFGDVPMGFGVVEMLDYGDGMWKYDDNQTEIGLCRFTVYTYGMPIFPVLIESLQMNNAKLFFLYITLMTRCLRYLSEEGVFHNNIMPDIFRVSSNHDVFIDSKNEKNKSTFQSCRFSLIFNDQ